jgi:hypothetical protein
MPRRETPNYLGLFADDAQPPVVKVQLHQCPFALGEMFDRLTLTTYDNRMHDQFKTTVPMLLALTERVLGYQLVSSDLATWHFKRETELRSM